MGHHREMSIEEFEWPDEVMGATVRYARVDPPDPAAHRLTDEVWATPDTVWIEVFGVKAAVHGTDEVVVEVPDDVDPSLIAPLIYGWATRMIMLHSGTFNLHASLVRIGDEHVAIGGHSGAGKSTTVVTLAREHGAAVLIDDVVHVEMVDGRPVAFPFDRPVHLTHDAIARLGIDPVGARIGEGPFSKLAIDLAESSDPVPIDRLVTLIAYDPEPDDEQPNTVVPEVLPTPTDPIVARAITGGERLRWIVRLANNTGLSSHGPRAGAFFDWSTAVAAALPTIEIARLRGADTLDRVCELVKNGRDPETR